MTGRISREALVWGLLLAATLVNWCLMEMGLLTGLVDQRLLGAAMLVIAFAKVWLVIDNFMEVREAPQPLRVTLAAWCVGVCAILIGQLFL